MLSSAGVIRLVLLFPALATVVLSQGSGQMYKSQKNNHMAKGSGDGETLTCTHYTQGNTTSAGCNEVPGRVCRKGCVGGIVANNCTLNHGDTPSQQTCTIAFGKSSATISVCGNEMGYFSCTGSWDGNGTCYGCRDTNPAFAGSGNQTEPSDSFTGDHNNTTNPPPADSDNESPTSAATSLSFGGIGALLILVAGALLN
ncbi:hypothetical protein O181_007880 [Austropuccinia psidii MF-1]|uniref:Secreted protein n=1 Tax=Austropuccinia psidii MF-1 TaxID=1389203 RepID=A0A9Q3BNV8_9BASI|nr:hypothetical protein [Austropuccinia psidii MF-1]